MSAAYIQVHFRIDFFYGSKQYDPDQAAPKGAVWSGFILSAVWSEFAIKAT